MVASFSQMDFLCRQTDFCAFTVECVATLQLGRSVVSRLTRSGNELYNGNMTDP